MNSLFDERSPPSGLDVAYFIAQNARLPRLGDDVAPWRYRGWLLPYVLELHRVIPAVADRWRYQLNTLEAGRLLDDPIPQIAFGAPDNRVYSKLRDWSRLVGNDCGGWSDFRTLLDWLCWALALTRDEPRVTDAVNEKLYRAVDVTPMLQAPHDYLGDFVAEGKAKGWNPTAFYPTPHNVVELMVRMTMADGVHDGSDPRARTVNDPCVGSGRMLLHASNYSLRLYGQDIDPLAVSMCLINGALYAPWLSFPLPEAIFAGDADTSTVRLPILPNALAA